jgi:hypothetical protein
MSVSGASVRQIPPRSGTAWQSRKSEPDRRGEPVRKDRPSTDEAPQAPPEPGVGQIVDRTV